MPQVCAPSHLPKPSSLTLNFFQDFQNCFMLFFWVSLSSAGSSEALSDFPHKCGSAEKDQRLDTWSGLRELRTAGKIRAWLGNVDNLFGRFGQFLRKQNGIKRPCQYELKRCNSILLVMVAGHIFGHIVML